MLIGQPNNKTNQVKKMKIRQEAKVKKLEDGRFKGKYEVGGWPKPGSLEQKMDLLTMIGRNLTGEVLLVHT